jgi:hypothetical protein
MYTPTRRSSVAHDNGVLIRSNCWSMVLLIVDMFECFCYETVVS